MGVGCGLVPRFFAIRLRLVGWAVHNGEKKGARMLTIRLPYPPTINHYYRYSKGSVKLGTAGLLYRENVKAAVWSEQGKIVTMRLRVGVSIELTMPDRRVRDIDNVLKALLDALQYAGVYRNDGQIEDLRVRKVRMCPPGAADVIVQELK